MLKQPEIGTPVGSRRTHTQKSSRRVLALAGSEVCNLPVKCMGFLFQLGGKVEAVSFCAPQTPLPPPTATLCPKTMKRPLPKTHLLLIAPSYSHTEGGGWQDPLWWWQLSSPHCNPRTSNSTMSILRQARIFKIKGCGGSRGQLPVPAGQWPMPGTPVATQWSPGKLTHGVLGDTVWPASKV